MKGKINGFFITLFVGILLFTISLSSKSLGDPYEVYQVYLNGKKMGLISSKDDLLNLIDKEESSIKESFNVDKVFPPTGLSIEKVYTYSDKLNDISDIYNDIKKEEPFSIKGYTVTITYNNEAYDYEGADESDGPREPLKIYLLDSGLIKESLYEVAQTFIGADDLKKFEEGTQSEIVDTGEKITSVYFDETITIKDSLISTEETIFTNTADLTKYLLYGTNDQQELYTVKEGEDLYKIAEDHHLNIAELLIVNPKYPSGNSLLTPGETLNVGLINPLVSIVYNKTIVSNVDVPYKTSIVTDDHKYQSYREVTTEGVNGVSKVTQDTKFVNGEAKAVNITQTEVIKEPINEIITKGTMSDSRHYEAYAVQVGDYAWPTLSPFLITSHFEWRWGKFHRGIDICGTGYGSPIFAVADGEVVRAQKNDGNMGNHIVIKHNDKLYTQYMHNSKILVKVGDHVTKGQKIALMGCSGECYGTHLHLGVWVDGPPYQAGSTVVDPCKTLFRC